MGCRGVSLYDAPNTKKGTCWALAACAILRIPVCPIIPPVAMIPCALTMTLSTRESRPKAAASCTKFV